jgi:hypothetical protein
MNNRVRSSKKFIGVYYSPLLNKWLACKGKNSKVTVATCETEYAAAVAFNDYTRAQHGHNGGFLLSRINDIPEEWKGEN